MHTKTHLLFILALSLLTPLYVTASVISIDAPNDAVVGKEYKVDFFVDTQGQTINAVEGLITYPTDLFDATYFVDGQSVISFWVKRPDLRTNAFVSGIIAGGFDTLIYPENPSNTKANIFSVVFTPKKVGVGEISFSEPLIIVHDGQGTHDSVTIEPILVAVREPVQSDESETSEEVSDDTESPVFVEAFIANDAHIFDGASTLVFLARDTGSGINYYEVSEDRGSFERAESPMLLKKQPTARIIQVRVFDNAGNSQLIELRPAAEPSSLSISYVLFAGGLVVAGYLLLWIRKKHQAVA